MNISASAPLGVNLRALAATFAPGRINFDPLGLVLGFKAYQIYTALDGKSDGELAALGLSRSDLPQVAMSAAQETRNI